MKVTALIPFKLNSERIPDKNFKILGHKPLFNWIIDTILSIKEIDKLIINTDAIEKLNAVGLPKDNRIIIRERVESLRGDFVSMNKIIEDDIMSFDSDIYLMTHTTNPFLSKETIINCIDIFKNSLVNNEYDSLFTVDKIQSRFYDSNANPINHDPNNLVRTQDLEPVYEENSNLYLFTKSSFLNKNARIGKKPFMYVNSKIESIDIDIPDDWKLAEIISQNYK